MADAAFSFSQGQLQDVANRVLALAREGGATACEVDVSEACGQSVNVRLGQIETLEYNQDKGATVTVYVGQQKGHASTSDFGSEALKDTVEAALAIARYTGADPCAGLADPALLATSFPDLDLYHPWALSAEDAIAMACRCEDAARAVDPRISNSEGAGVSTQTSHFVYANSNGFLAGYPGSRHSLSAAVIASENGAMQRDYWFTSARAPEDLDDAVSVGRRAGERALRRLGGRSVKTGNYPVLFEAPIASSLIGHLVSAVSGASLYRKSTFLLDTLGKPVMAACMHIDEDPFVPRGLASGAFDSEGVATRARRLIDGGVLGGYFLGSYSARKLGMQSSGNAGGSHNLIVHDTGESFDAMLARMGTGLLVTELMGHGLNLVTGDYSRGAAGFWVENGVIAYPVEEITIAGNLADMFQAIEAVGTDCLTRGGKRCGSILVGSMTVAGSH